MNVLRGRISVDYPRARQDSLFRAYMDGELARHGIDVANLRGTKWDDEKMRIWRGIRNMGDQLWYQLQCRDINTILDQLTRQEQHANWLAQWLARLSPYGCLQNACLSFAGTGFAHEVALRTHLEEVSQGRMDRMIEYLRTGGDPNNITPETFPQFHPPRQPLVAALSGGLLDTAILAATCVLFLLIGYTAFLRMEAQ